MSAPYILLMWVRVKCSMQHTGEHHTLIRRQGMVGERGLPAHEALRGSGQCVGMFLLVFINGQRAARIVGNTFLVSPIAFCGIYAVH